jgi:hypothetical protein
LGYDTGPMARLVVEVLMWAVLALGFWGVFKYACLDEATQDRWHDRIGAAADRVIGRHPVVLLVCMGLLGWFRNDLAAAMSRFYSWFLTP